MNIWTLWLDAVRGLLHLLSSETGLGLGLAIVAATLLLRAALLPISWSAAYGGCIRQKKMMRLQPELQSIKEKFRDKPDLYMQHMAELYRQHGLTIVDGKSFLAALIQMPLFLGMYQVLRTAGEGVRFLWIPNLLKPDIGLALIAALTTALMIVANPDLPEQLRMFMILVPSIIAFMAALKFCSALAVYWTASNCFSAVQTAAIHLVVGHRIRAGRLNI